MKRIANSFLAVVGATMLTITTYGQMANNPDLMVEVDQEQTNNLPMGLDPRVSIATDQPVEWSKSAYGFAGSYMLDNTHYMAIYDNESHYVETYMKVDWSKPEVSSIVKQSLLASGYKAQTVMAYWVSSDPDEYGYYLELKDKNGKHSSIWADTKGNFYDRPYDYSTTTISGQE